jgi:nitrile hydratase subunit alpha
MTTILLQNNTISQIELDKELMGDDVSTEGKPPVYRVGDVVQVKSEDTRVRWRKPHLRCPGYLFNCTGIIEKYIGRWAPLIIIVR